MHAAVVDGGMLHARPRDPGPARGPWSHVPVRSRDGLHRRRGW